MIWCVSHTHTLIDGSAAESQQELLRNVTAVGESSTAPGWAGPPRLPTVCCWNTAGTLFLIHFFPS